MPTKDFTVSACLPYIESSGSGANPGDKHLPLGKWASGTGLSWVTRALVKASISFAGMSSINSATLRLSMHTGSNWHAKGSGSVGLTARRRTKDWSEGDGGSTATDETWGGGEMGTQVKGNTTADGEASGSVSNGASDGAVETITITNIVRDWFQGAPNYGLRLNASAEGDPSNACEAYSRRESGEAPVIRIDYETNQAPNAPTDLQPAGGNTVHTGRTITYTGTRSDPDGGDYLTAYEIEVYTLGDVKVQEHTGEPGGQPTSFTKSLTLPAGYECDQSYYWRGRTRDKENVWGGWSGNRQFLPNSVPDTPGAPGVEVDTLAPQFAGSFSDPDPNDTPTAAQVEVETITPAADKWISPEVPISTPTFAIAYAGSALAWGTAYRARLRVKDNRGGWSAWGAWANWTPTQPTGPDLCTPRTTATKLASLTPTLTVAASFSFRNDEIEVYAANSLTSTRLWLRAFLGADYAAATSKAYPYAGTALAWGGTYYWRARVEDAAGLVGAWTALQPFYINAEPGAAANLAARTSVTAPPAISNGVYLVTTLTPRLEAEFADPDLGPYADRPSSRTVEVYARNADGSAGALLHTNTLASPPYTVPMVYTYPAAPALVMGNSYLVRWRFTDNAGRQGPYSPYLSMRVTQGPAVTAVAPGAGAVVTDQTPAFAWDYTSPAGKAQAAYRLQVFDLGPIAAPTEETLLFDTDVQAGTAESFQLPAGIVADDHAYRWAVTVADTDGLAAVLA